MKRRTKQEKARAKRRAERAQRAGAPGGASAYARKRAYLSKRGLWGFECFEKPWRRT